MIGLKGVLKIFVYLPLGRVVALIILGLFLLADQSVLEADETELTQEASMTGEVDDSGESKKVSDDEDKSGLPPNAFENFKLILDRNIFNPDRRAPRERDKERERQPEPPREESFTLLGTMSYADKQLAFFSGTDSEWSGAVKLGESLANHKVSSVDYDKVILEYEGKIIELSIGAGRLKRGEEAWNTTDQSELNSSRSSSDRMGSNVSDSGEPDLSGLESNDILKQLMERRKQQMGQ